MTLSSGDTGILTGPTEVGTAKPKEDATSPLSEVIRTINDRFGTDFTDEDRLLMEQVVGDLAKDEGLSAQARSNSLDNFRHVFEPKATKRCWSGTSATARLSNGSSRTMRFGGFRWIMIREYYSRARAGSGTGSKADQSAAEAAARPGKTQAWRAWRELLIPA